MFWFDICFAYLHQNLGGCIEIMTCPKLYIPSTLNIDLILWHTQLILCAENVKSWFKSWVFPFTFQAYILPHTLNCMCVRAVLVLPKTASSAQTYKSMSFIWIVWSTLYVYLWCNGNFLIWWCLMIIFISIIPYVIASLDWMINIKCKNIRIILFIIGYN